ncbi:MAG: sigma-54 dependent transcriptional regulator [Vicinamibacterales bacterium]|nr:sigma-54 dependent transcriptional regulator [Vicinamibacterales bacterium]
MLLVDDEAPIRKLLSEIATREGFAIHTCPEGDAALETLAEHHFDLMMVDLRMPGLDGLEVLRRARPFIGSTHVVLMTGYGSIDSAVDAIKLGAAEYLQKPLNLSRVRELMREVRASVERREAVVASEGALAERLEFCGMIGRSAQMQELFTTIRRLAPFVRTTLISGETGVGKELVARALHTLGPRREKRFATVNCSAVVETLFESELFGHVRGAFTGATDHKIGLFESADGGTIFLDEVGELPLAVQSKLLRVLETGEVQRVGSVDSRKCDVRVVAATNRNLEVEVAEGRFRSDLYFRLNIVELVVPPLRTRREDIPYLAAAFLRHFAREFKKPIAGITPSAERLLIEAPWPGNIRELRNTIERACLLGEGRLLTERELQPGASRFGAAPDGVVRPPVPPPASTPSPVVPLPDREAVVAALGQAGGNRAAAARALGISRRAFYRLLEKYALQ